jgi:hypothetical protein
MNAEASTPKAALKFEKTVGPLITRKIGTVVSIQLFSSNAPARLGALCTIAGLVVVFASPLARAQGMGPCAQVRMVCEQAGFVPGAFREGNGLQIHCIRPIMQGIPQPPSARKPMPSIDPQLVVACKARNPNFGQPRAAALSRFEQPPEPPGPAQTAAVPQPPDRGQPAPAIQAQTADASSPCGPSPALPPSSQ